MFVVEMFEVIEIPENDDVENAFPLVNQALFLSQRERAA